ncbi:MAG: glycosyltransferase [Brevinema sp.]
MNKNRHIVLIPRIFSRKIDRIMGALSQTPDKYHIIAQMPLSIKDNSAISYSYISEYAPLFDNPNEGEHFLHHLAQGLDTLKNSLPSEDFNTYLSECCKAITNTVVFFGKQKMKLPSSFYPHFKNLFGAALLYQHYPSQLDMGYYWMALQPLPTPAKGDPQTIAILEDNMYEGGGQRVTSLLIQHFVNKGYKVVLFTAKEPHEKDFNHSQVEERYILKGNVISIFEKAIEKHHIGLFIVQEWTQLPYFRLFSALKFLDMKLVYYRHTNYFYAMRHAPEVAQLFFYFTYMVDAMLVLCPPESSYWHSLGRENVLLHQNFLTIEPSPEKNSCFEPIIIWCGRLCSDKNPLAAIEGFHKYLERSSDLITKLVLIGDGDQMEVVKDFIRSQKLSDRIELAGFTNPEYYYQRASLHLMTSVSEGSPMVLGETKSYGVGTLMFDIPMNAYHGTSGVISVPQGDTEKLAEQLEYLFGNEAMLKQLGEDAKQSTEPYQCDQVMKSCQTIIASLYAGVSPTSNAIAPEHFSIVTKELTALFSDRDPAQFVPLSRYDLYILKLFRSFKKWMKHLFLKFSIGRNILKKISSKIK